MKYRKYYAFVAFAVAVLSSAAFILLFLFTGSRAWHCSPVAPRPSGVEAWEEAMAPAQTPEGLDDTFFDSFTVRSDDEEYKIEYPSRNPPDNVFAYELCETSPGEPLRLGSGILTFRAIGAAYLDATQTIADEAEYRFYDARLQSITDEQAGELGIYGLTESGENFRYSPFPAIQLVFHHQGIEDLKFHSLRVYDTHTRQLLSTGYGSFGRKRHMQFSTHVSLWHRSPVDIVLDISYGPSKIFEFAPRAGEGFSEGSFECRLLTVLDGVDTGYSSSSGSNNTFTHTFRKAPPDKGEMRFVFVCQPKASQMPVSFEFLDAEGNVLPTRGSSTSSHVHCVNMRQPLEKVALIRARYRTQRQRIVIHLSYVPGLPEENKSIDDLFDMRVPHVRLHDPGQVSEFLRKTLQLKNSRRAGQLPPSGVWDMRSPLDFQDVTVREIAQVYAEGGTQRVDMEKEQLSLEYPVPLVTKLRRFMQRLFRR
ncbi:MAG: hypothetical protein ACYSWO_03255 [Planctomycetota bacterium]